MSVDATAMHVIIAALAAIPSTLAAIAGLIVVLRNRDAIRTLHVQINSRMDDLLEKSNQIASAQGYAKGLSARIGGEES